MLGGPLFIIPFRPQKEVNREAHLIRWMKHYAKIFKEDLNVCVVEQVDELPFARGPLFNCAFKEEGYKYPYIIVHDTDMYIDPKKSDPFETYSYPVNPTHVATRLQRFNYGPGYDDFFGGVNIFTREQYLDFDGFHGQIFGWGVDDDSCRNRIRACGYTIDKRETFFFEEKHKRPINPHVIRQNLQLVDDTRENWPGVSVQQYTLISREQHPDGYLHLKVSFDK